MSFGINTVTVSGNLTRDPELRTFADGGALCTFGIAYNKRRKDQNDQWVDETHYFDVAVRGGQGKWMGENLTKGMPVVVSGELRWRGWTDAQTGQNRTAVSIAARDVVIPSTGRGGGSNDQRQRQPQPQQQPGPQAQQHPPVQPNWSEGAGFGTQQPQAAAPGTTYPVEQATPPPAAAPTPGWDTGGPGGPPPAAPVPAGGDSDDIPFRWRGHEDHRYHEHNRFA